MVFDKTWWINSEDEVKASPDRDNGRTDREKYTIRMSGGHLE